MSAILKKAMVVIVLATLTITVVYANQPDNEDNDAVFRDNAFVDDIKLDSNRYSHPDDTRSVDESMYIELTDDDVLTLQNEYYDVYLNEETLTFKVVDLETNYVWSTAIDNPNAGEFNDFLSNSIGFEYINLDANFQLRENIGLRETEFVATKDSSASNDTIAYDIEIGGFCSTRRCERFYDNYVDGDYALEDLVDDGFNILDVGFRLEVTLTDQGLSVHIPYDSIFDGNPEAIQLSSIIIFPSLGATEMDLIPGYMMIPEGVGALIRYEDQNDRFESPYISRFYGNDFGVTNFANNTQQYGLSMPIFGAVHGVNQNGFIAMIESGDMNARLHAYPNGATNIPYNLIFTKFDLKQTYTQSFTSDGSSGATRIYQGNTDDITMHYNFTNGENANYVGLARLYQEHLIDTDVLTPLDESDEAIPIHLQYLMADSKNRFIGQEVVEMTTVDDVMRMYTYFKNNGLTHQNVSLLGWNDGGYSGHLPSDVDFENALGRNNNFEAMLDAITVDDTVMLVNNYIWGSSGTSGLSYRNDVAEGVDQFKLSYRCDFCVYKDNYLLYPSYSSERSLADLEDYQALGVDVMFESLGNLLYSTYDRDLSTRSDAYQTYEEIIDAYRNIGHYITPNAYALQGTTSYYDAPLYNNQYNFFDDLVPIIPVVLSGHMDMFSQFLNYNSLGVEQLLMLIDFGILPSYILTEERPSMLQGTDIEYYYSSEYDAWRDTIIEEYTFISNALNHVYGSSIVARDILDTGISKVTYENGVVIVVNYTSEAYTYNAETIDPLNYHVWGDDNA